jgi:hypothetical protein
MPDCTRPFAAYVSWFVPNKGQAGDAAADPLKIYLLIMTQVAVIADHTLTIRTCFPSIPQTPNPKY